MRSTFLLPSRTSKLCWGANCCGVQLPGRDRHSQRPVVAPPEKANSTAEKAYLMGRQHELMREYGRAIDTYSECVKSDPLHIPAMVRLAELYYRRMDYGQALAWARKALELDTYHPAANFVCGTILKNSGNLGAAREALSWAARSPEYRSAAYTLMAETLSPECQLRGGGGIRGQGPGFQPVQHSRAQRRWLLRNASWAGGRRPPRPRRKSWIAILSTTWLRQNRGFSIPRIGAGTGSRLPYDPNCRRKRTWNWPPTMPDWD